MRDSAKAVHDTQNVIGKGNDWGLLESDLASPEKRYGQRRGESGRDLYEGDSASPEERQAQRRRENALNHSEYRGQERQTRPAGRDRESDRDIQRRGRAKDVERFDDRPKKRQNYRGRGADEDDEYDDDRDEFDIEGYRARKEATRRRKEEKRAAKEALAPKTISLPDYITVLDLARALGVKPKQFLSDLGELGFENTLLDSIMTGETAALVASEYGLEPTLDTGDEIDLKPRPLPEDLSLLPPRPPIVTIMGHVDHGKTTILDWLRKSSVAAQEHGGITQHIGAFSVRLSSGKVITFLDTPGHAAFLSMRQRGANVTDMVVLVVAVDDSVKPQTLEALKHTQNAKVPIIVAINKIDMDERRIDQVKQDLAGNGVEIEDFGGDVQVVGVSGKTGQGMDSLEESILTLSEILDVRAETDGMAEGWILEASVKVDGKAATVLVKRGTMRVGDVIVAGTTYARIRMMRNEAGVNIEEAGPGMPVEVLGWRDSPMAGDLVLQAEDEDRAHTAVHYREELAERTKTAARRGEEEQKNREKTEQEALEKMMAEDGEDSVPPEAEDSGPKTVNTIVRGDVMGSVEAVSTAVMEIGNNEVHARILGASPGQINESDIELMAVAKGCIINFNSPIPGHIKSMAEEKGVRILDHTIIYHLVEDVKELMSEQLPPILSQRVLAEAEVLQVFSINIVKRKFKNIAGVKVKTGSMTRGGLYRVMRDGEKIFEGKLDALKQGKKDVKEMRRGTECGLSFESWDEFEPGDVIQLFEEVRQKRYL
ncbi:translation initiation factor IF-2 [Diaporthe australafricana]|uniref:Translation initiation factor IF-2, mitochondrial n=1 Tax=Diaporthe australafricana TaxID=127596 RepID=A0ABR3WHT7_9PEZI